MPFGLGRCAAFGVKPTLRVLAFFPLPRRSNHQLRPFFVAAMLSTRFGYGLLAFFAAAFAEAFCPADNFFPAPNFAGLGLSHIAVFAIGFVLSESF